MNGKIRREQVYEYIKANRSATKTEIAQALGISQSLAANILAELTRSCIVYCIQGRPESSYEVARVG